MQAAPEAAAPSRASLLLQALTPVAAGTLLAGVALWPAYELLRAGCGDARHGYEFMTSYSLHPRQVITFLFPHWCGPWTDTGRWLHWEICGYVGGLGLLTVLAVTRRGFRESRVFRGLALLALVGLVLAFGKYTPLYHVLQHVPYLNRFRCAGRWLLIWSGALSLLVGLALQAYGAGLGQPSVARKLLRLFAVVAVCGVVLGALIFWGEGLLRPLAGVALAALHGRGGVPPASEVPAELWGRLRATGG
ncbi:MAG: hypothetical protein KKI08_20135, partial [Armatimonadetes bacterium]|nr:hypothetical protein [Armatimonadota bacterium]